MNLDRFKVRTVNGVKQQCTGLRDVKGNLIYEGDYVKYTKYHPKRVEEWHVEYDEDSLEFVLTRDICRNGFCKFMVENNRIEVIK